jgi:alpha-galactosidase
MRIVLVGAGSHSFGGAQIADILQSTELRGRGISLWLVDEDPLALDRMTRLANRIRAHTGTDVAVESTPDRQEALPGARYVITAVARQRMALWEQDFRVPLAHGCHHCLGENGGPGALFHTLRSLELMLPICRDLERLCPEALLLNFTNPEARVLHAICHLTRVRAAGICHGVYTALASAARYLQRPLEGLEIISAGMNHFYCLRRVTDRATGADLLPALLERVLADDPAATPPLFRTFAEIFGLFVFPSDDHIGEYVSFGAEFSGTRWHYGQECRPVRRDRASAEPQWVEAVADGRAPVDERVLRPSGEVTVPIISDIELDRHAFRPAVNVLNSGGYIANLPSDCVVEVPAHVDAQGLHPVSVGSLPESFAALIRPHLTIAELITEAFRTRSRQLLLQALVLDPNVHSTVAARRLLDEMLLLQRDWLPSFA